MHVFKEMIELPVTITFCILVSSLQTVNTIRRQIHHVLTNVLKNMLILGCIKENMPKTIDIHAF